MTRTNTLVLTKPRCVQCDATFRAMNALGIPYEKEDIEDTPERATALGYLSVPVVIAPDGSHWGGYQPAKIKALAA